MMRRDGRPRRPLASTAPGAAGAALAVAVLAAGCSAAPGGQGVASLPGHRAAAHGAAPMTQQQGDHDMISFARCMRGHGVQMADPFHRPGHAGLSIDLPTQDPATHLGYVACQHFLQPIIAAKQAGMPRVGAATLAALTRYAQCMRGHDISMLDPTSFGALSLGNVPGITSDFGRSAPQFRAADSACRHLLPAGVHDDGTGP
ncbi:MAG TPA: hypothetical protein VIJ82_31335 [Streptosporangiaceae bacterium]|jgi:hypothetical protein